MRFNNFLKEKPKFSLIVLLVFVLFFTAAGVYMIYQSLAADTYDIVDGSFTTPTGKNVQRIWGNDRYATALGMSQKAFTSSGCVVLVYGSDWPDATSASALAGSCDGPILLAGKDNVNTQTANEIKRLNPSKIYLVGGTVAGSTSLENQLKSISAVATLKKIFGATRYDTNIAVAEEVYSLNGNSIPDKTIMVVTGNNFPDSITVSALAALKKYPVIFVDGALSQKAQTFITEKGITKSIIVGGTGAVSAAVEASLPGAIRVSGADRYQTSYNFALYAIKNFTGVSAANIGIATGANYPDALSAGPFLAKKGNSVLILDNVNSVGYVSKLVSAYKSVANKIYIFGGSVAISNGNYLMYANNLGADYTLAQVKTQQMVDKYIEYCPLLAGSTVDYGYASGYRAVSYPYSARIMVSPTGPDENAPLSKIIYHEIYHIYDWRDGDTNRFVAHKGFAVLDWGESIPPSGPINPPCVTNAYNAIGYVLKY